MQVSNRYQSLKRVWTNEFLALECALTHRPSVFKELLQIIDSGQLLIFPFLKYAELKMSVTPPPKRREQGFWKSKYKQLNPQSALDIYKHAISTHQAWIQKAPKVKYLKDPKSGVKEGGLASTSSSYDTEHDLIDSRSGYNLTRGQLRKLRKMI